MPFTDTRTKPFDQAFTSYTPQQLKELKDIPKRDYVLQVFDFCEVKSFLICNYTGWCIIEQMDGTYFTMCYDDSFEGTREECFSFLQTNF